MLQSAFYKMEELTCRDFGILRGLNFRGARSILWYRESAFLGAPMPFSRRSWATVFMPTHPEGSDAPSQAKHLASALGSAPLQAMSVERFRPVLRSDPILQAILYPFKQLPGG